MGNEGRANCETWVVRAWINNWESEITQKWALDAISECRASGPFSKRENELMIVQALFEAWIDDVTNEAPDNFIQDLFQGLAKCALDRVSTREVAEALIEGALLKISLDEKQGKTT